MSNHRYVKAGPGHGTPMHKKTDGYAQGPVPPQALPAKPGKVDQQGYTGPPVAKRSQNE